MCFQDCFLSWARQGTLNSLQTWRRKRSASLNHLEIQSGHDMELSYMMFDILHDNEGSQSCQFYWHCDSFHKRRARQGQCPCSMATLPLEHHIQPPSELQLQVRFSRGAKRPLTAVRRATGSLRAVQLVILGFVNLCVLASPPSRKQL